MLFCSGGWDTLQMRGRKWFKSHELEPEDGTVTKVRCVRFIFAGVTFQETCLRPETDYDDMWNSFG